MDIHWLTGRGESRVAKPVAEFTDENGFRWYVAFDPDFQQWRVFQHLAYGDADSPCVEVSGV